VTRSPRIAFALVLVATACNLHPARETRLERQSEVTSTICVPPPPAVDVLLVVDDSASMADHLPALVRALDIWGQIYDDEVRRLDYRIAVTTADVRQPWCDSVAEDGAFVATSCRARLDDFVTDADANERILDGAIDLRALCTDACAHATISTLPTAIEPDGERRGRPWIERHEGVLNLAADVSASEALTCLGLVGVSGCAYESPLEAASLALQRAQDPRDPAFGFLRREAALFVLFVGDESDCSVRPEHAAIFDPDGDGALWADGATAPSSAVCWNAGMRCTGAGDPYDRCDPLAIDASGVEADDDAAVLQPLSKYIEQLRAIELDKQHAITSDAQRVFVRVLGGVRGIDGADVFADALDPIEQASLGIGPGCTSEGARAYPPGRTRAVAEAFPELDQPTAYGLCESDFAAVPACVPGQWPPPRRHCVEACVADADPSTDALEIDCVMTEIRTDDGATRTIPTCDGDELPPGADACVRWTTGDELEEWCSDAGFDVGYRILRAVPIAEGSCLTATCTASQQPFLDCPGLP
jgi:hypothetical protein